jgi:hypothetical protein
MPTIIGKWSRAKGNITVNMPRMRRVGGKWYPEKSKYLGNPDDPFSPIAVEKDIYAEYKIKVKLVPTSSRGGDIVEVK